MNHSVVSRACLVSGMPHILLAPDQSPGWQSLHDSYGEMRRRIEASDADLILYFSTQWLSVIGYLFQANPKPAWTLVDMDWHEFGSIPYEFDIDPDFAQSYAAEVKKLGCHTACVNYYGFPIDTGTVVAQKLLNPDNRLPAAMVSCNMYSDKNEIMQIGQAGARALAASGKKAIVVLVSNLSNRFFTHEINYADDRISSAKDHEWNLKLCELFGEGRMEDVSQCARDVAREANGDMGFRGIWWLNGLLGQTNHFKGDVIDYQAVYGSGAAIVDLVPTQPVQPLAHLELESESEVIEQATLHDPKLKSGPSLPMAAAHHPEPKPLVKPAPKAGNQSQPSPVPPKAKEATYSTGKAPEPVGAYPHARKMGELLFLSGIGPRKPGTKDIPGVTMNEAGEVVEVDIEAQTRSVIENVGIILENAGKSMNDIVDVQVFLTNMKRDFQKFNAVYAETFTAIGATRTTVEITSLPTPIAVEFKIIAKA